jgi:zinc protease
MTFTGGLCFNQAKVELCREQTMSASTLIQGLKLRLVAVLWLSVSLVACSGDSSTPAVSERSNTAAGPGYTLLDRVSAEDAEINIPYSKYRLDNGLTLIIHEDDSDPLIHVDVTYHVGSAREEAQRSGFAHFFEHMMFQGSQHVGDDEHFKIVSESGGTMNGTTNADRTNYFQTVPSNQLETMLWLESDRMGFLLPAVTQEKFEIQRATVKNERGQNVENRPYGRFSEVNDAAMYPPEHPYSWPVIGYTEDLDAATLDDLKRFFLRWYGPNNATLTVGGNLDVQEVLDLTVKYFGEIPAGPGVEPDAWPAPVLQADRYVSYVDRNIRFPALLFTWPTVPLGHPDSIALDALNEIIGVGRKSFLYKEFVLTQKAIDASGFHNSMELGGALTFFVMPFPGTSLSQFETELRAVIDNFGPDSISDEDLQIFKAQQEASLINRLASVRGKVSMLAFYETFYGDPDQVQKELAEIRALTEADIIRVFNTYVKDRPAVIQSVVPANDPEGQARPDSYVIPPRLSRTEAEEQPLQLRDITSAFDREARPVPGPSPLVIMPEFYQTQLGNGVPLIGTLDAEVPLVNLRLVFEGGRLAKSPNQSGITALTAAMMNEGTANYSAEDFEKELQKLGSSINVSGGNENMVISMQSLLRNLDATLALLEERLFHYRLTQEDLDRLRQQQIESLQADMQQPSAIAANNWSRMIYGADHAFAFPFAGSQQSLQSMTLEDIEAFSRGSLNAANLKVIAVGEVPQQELVQKLDFLQALPASGLSIREQPASPSLPGGTLYFIDKPGAAQSEIRIGYLGTLTYDPVGEYFERYLMNYVLGGAFNSRININLREDKGYTYGARSGFSANRLPGPFTASASVLGSATAASVVEFMNEITGYRDQGITAAELQFTKDAIGQSEALDYETPGQKASLLQQIITYNLDRDFVRQQQALINNLNTERVNALARQHLPVEDMVLLVVGDKASTWDELAALGYPMVELDAEGNPL